MRNARRRHLMRLDATPPAEWGDRFTVRGMFRQSLLSGSAGDFDGWTGQLFAEFGRVDASRVRQYVNMDTLGVELIRGNGALRAWADVSKGRSPAGRPTWRCRTWTPGWAPSSSRWRLNPSPGA
jgi:hypothetical protein